MKHFLIFLLILYAATVSGQGNLNNQKINGYKGIWFTLGQFSSDYGDKYSGGLGTYTAKHRPLAIYAPEVNKTFFVYGGTTNQYETHLLCMVSYFDHRTGQVPKPTVVFDKLDVNDPHDNPSLLLDSDGYLWVFVSGRGRIRPGFKYKSQSPYDINTFIQITEEEMTYPQPHFIEENGFFNFFTKYTGVRELYFETSDDGVSWTNDIKLAAIIEEGATKGGHYQISERHGNVLGTFFNRHPNGVVDQRTDLYYIQSNNFGKSWTNILGEKLNLPLINVDSKARIKDYSKLDKNVYLKDMGFDQFGNPVCLYLISNGHHPGPENGPRDWQIAQFNGKTWKTKTIFQSDHNYDMGSLYIQDNLWTVIAPTDPSPYKYHSGGEMLLWESIDSGTTWKQKKKLTQNSNTNHNYARRPVNAKNPFFSLWADGDPSAFSKSQLYFTDSAGNVYLLPYEMKTDTATPEKIY